MHAVIFDVDGTLWDSTEAVADSWRRTFRSLNLPCDHVTGERLRREFGKTLPDIGFSLYPDLPRDRAIAVTEQACEEENAHLLATRPPVYPEIPALFQRLREEGIPIYIVSNCQSGYIEVLLETSGLAPFVSGHLCAGDTGVAKAETLGLAVKRWQIPSPVYVGDTLGDEEATRKAGLLFIHAAYGFGEAKAPDAVIRSPLELPEVLRRLGDGA